ncbi:hypothetical protein ILUMI_21925 [Ignelater luminosus]|uniref:PCNA-associated factor n=1 Tax=Ignelater luminosus TaxID=2038154 RepID=A0A8K0G3D7_IGNLU|nr:hypothetical protein ILUMI_21925 [Ignelater luminosus]
MVRTADSVLRVAGGKSSRKGGSVSARDTSGSPSSSSADKGGGGLNPICPRETPAWQKPITNFFTLVEKNKPQDNRKVQNEPGSSKNTSDLNDVNMIEGSCEITKQDHESRVEVMDEENEEDTTKINNDTENKENNTLNGNANDAEMKELDDTKKKNVRSDDDYEEVAPRKKIKLDADVCRRLREFEQ